MPRPFFGRCRAPSTWKAGQDGPGTVLSAPSQASLCSGGSAPSAGPQGGGPLNGSQRQGRKSSSARHLRFSGSFQWSFCIYLIKSTSVLRRTSLKGLHHRERKQKSLLGGGAHPPYALPSPPSRRLRRTHPEAGSWQAPARWLRAGSPTELGAGVTLTQAPFLLAPAGGSPLAPATCPARRWLPTVGPHWTAWLFRAETRSQRAHLPWAFTTLGPAPQWRLSCLPP